ncbi:MAG: hypothetical protein AB7F91_15710 [Parvularculaceae bacterium]|nr:hypothetical protein [Parvularculaceae bacterium]
MAAILAAGGCAGGLKRIAPPGIVKYEDRAKGQPVSPAIEARIDAYQTEEAGGFPKLGEQPSIVPDGIASPERAAMQETLLGARDALNAAVEVDRAAALAERGAEEIETRRDALGAAVKKDDAAARRERGLPPRPVEDDSR